MANKTRDGLKLKKVLSALEQLAGVVVRVGTNHPYVAMSKSYAMVCPVAASTNARKMIVPWVKRTSEYSNSNEIYHALRTGGWN